jgi:hypothetical protein
MLSSIYPAYPCQNQKHLAFPETPRLYVYTNADLPSYAVVVVERKEEITRIIDTSLCSSSSICVGRSIFAESKILRRVG